MKILFYNHTGKVSGAERMLLTILSGLDRDRFEPAVLCPEDGELAHMVSNLGVDCDSSRSLQARFTLRPIYLARYLFSFAQLIRQLRHKVKVLRPNLLHANSIRAGLVATAATVGLDTDVVWHLHDLLPRHPLSNAVRVFALLFKRSRMIAVSEAVADNFAGRWSSLRSRVSVIVNGIDLEMFGPVEGVREAKRVELQLTDNEFAIGIVGLLTPRKGQLGLIKAFARVRDDVPHASLIVVGSAMFDGDQEYEQLLRNTTTQLGLIDRVRFLGARSDVSALLPSFDLLVMNSSVEPFGLVLVEAMASGTPIVATNTGGIPEVIKSEHNGLLVEPGDPEMLTNAIVRLAQRRDTCVRLASQARRDVEIKFSHIRVLDELQRFYEAVHSPELPVAKQTGKTGTEAARTAV